MKFTIHQKTLSRALECGAVASLSEEAQSDTSNLALLMKAIKITVDATNLTVESATNLMAVKYTIPVNTDNKIEVKEPGTIMVPAKEFVQWVDKQGSSVICVVLSQLDNPEFITVGDDKESSKHAIKKIGTVKFVSKDESKTGNKWALDCYDPSQSVIVDFKKPEVLFEAPASQVIEAIKYTAFASMPKHYEHVYDSMLFETFDKNLYIAACDTARCSVYKMDKVEKVNQNLVDGKIRVLIPCTFINTISKLIDVKSKMIFYYDEVKNRVFVSQTESQIGLEFRIATADKDLSKKFPPISMLLKKSYVPLCNVQKQLLHSRLATASMVNKSTAMFTFNKLGNSLTIKTISESGLNPSICVAPANDLTGSRKVVWAVQHVTDAIKVVKDETLSILMPKDNDKGQDNGSFKVVSTVDSNFSYYSMSVNNSKYDLNEAD